MNRFLKLLVSLAIDGVGLFSLGGAEPSDLVWAPASALAIGLLYQRDRYTYLAFGEELLPGTDFIPTATIAWLDENGFLGFLEKKSDVPTNKLAGMKSKRRS